MKNIKRFINDLKQQDIHIWAEKGNISFKAPVGVMNDEIKSNIRNKKALLLHYLEESQRIKRYDIINEGGISNAIVEVEPKEISQNETSILRNKIVKTSETFIEKHLDEINDEELTQWVNHANMVAIYDMFKAFYNSGIFITDEYYHIDSILMKMDIDTDYKNFLIKWLEVLVRHGVIESVNNQYKILDEKIILKIEEDYWGEFEKVENKINYGYSFFEYMKQCSKSLTHILQKKVKTVDLLFPKGASVNAEGVYSNNKGSVVFNSLVGDIILSYIKERKEKGQIRILEIGAGIGGTTRSVIETIKEENYKYYYTDISHYFLNKAKKVYENYNMEFCIFDINKPFYKQINDFEKFDIILCANMLHNSKNGDDSLKSINHLLDEKGMFIIIDETTEPEFLLTSIELNDALNDFDDERKVTNGVFFTYDQWKSMFEKSKANIWIDFPQSSQGLGTTGQKLFVGNFNYSYSIDKDVILESLHDENIDNVIIADKLVENKSADTKFNKETLGIMGNSIVQIKEIWESILNIKDIKEEDNFFHIGGDSLVITQVITKLWDTYPITQKISWKEFAEIISENPTLANLSCKVDKLIMNDEKNIDNERCLVEFNNHKDNVRKIDILFHDGTGELNIYNNLVSNYENKNMKDHWLYGIRYEVVDSYDPKNFFNTLAIKYAKVIASKFKDDDIRLVGHCVGGLIALETSKILKDSYGIEVKETIMISSYLNEKNLLNNQSSSFLKESLDSDFLLAIIFNELVKTVETKDSITREIIEKLFIEKNKSNFRSIEDFLEKSNIYPDIDYLYKKYKEGELVEKKYIESFNSFKKHFKAAAEYTPPVYNGNVSIICSNEDTKNFFIEGKGEFNDSIQIWSKFLTGNIKYNYVNGNHLSILDEKNICNIMALIGW